MINLTGDIMKNGVIVCNWCKGDHLGACSDANSKRGFAAHCFDCHASCNILEVPLDDVSTRNERVSE